MFLRSKIQEVMLRERSRAVGGKHGLMSDATSVTSPTAAALMASPRLFEATFSAKGHADHEAVVSPTSTLETHHFSARGSPFSSNRSTGKPLLSESATAHEVIGEPRTVGLGLLDALADEDSGKTPSRTESRMVVFGPQLKIRIPPATPCSVSPTRSPHIPIEFGIKTKNSLLALNSPAWRPPAAVGCTSSDSCTEASSPQAFMRNITARELELSEDYTCVILHGPNPRTIHIFDNFIIESSGDGCISSMEEKGFSNEQCHSSCDGDELLCFCSACKRKIGQEDGIFMYKGQKVFCSHECRCQEMLFDAVE